MKVILFGATGMVGQGVLRECLLDRDVERVLAVGRSSSGVRHDKFGELILSDLMNYSSVENQLLGYDACFFCLGVTSAGKSEQDYSRVTYDLTIAAAQTLAKLNPTMTFIYVSGTGTDSTERGRMMWARVKGKTENELMRMFPNAYMFRPGYIQPLHGIRTKTAWYSVFYAVLAPIYPVLRRLIPKYVTTTEEVGKAMLEVTKHGYPKKILESPDITAAGSEK